MDRFCVGVLSLLTCVASAHAGARDLFSELEKDFGTTPRGPILTHYFLIKNHTQQPINIGIPRVSCGCVSASVLRQVLQPGESTAVYAAMDTNRIQQSYVTKTVTVYVPFYGQLMEEIPLTVKAVARDDLFMSPHGMAFGTLVMGQGGKASVKFSLLSPIAWEVTDVSSSGIYLKPSAKLVKRTASETSYEVQAELDPGCPIGNWMAEIWLKSATAGLERIRVPVSVKVVPAISVQPEALNLNDISLGKETEYRVMLQGDKEFKILQVKGVGETVEVKAPNEQASVKHTLTIVIKPKEAGDLSTTLEIETDNQLMPLVKLPVKAKIPNK